MTKPISKSRIKVEPDTKKPGWDFLKDGVKKNPLYHKPYNTKRTEAANIIKENCDEVNKVVPGQIVLFDYFEPKTKEELEYYDATPLVIYFNDYISKDGNPMCVGFNVHYYPPKIRYNIVQLIYRLFTPLFKATWDGGVKETAQYFNYQFLIDELAKYNLDFGVRQYDRRLMTNTHLVPTKWLSTAVFTEGHFKKETRAAIMSYWKNWTPTKKKK